jgi:hypothetical protein
MMLETPLAVMQGAGNAFLHRVFVLKMSNKNILNL